MDDELAAQHEFDVSAIPADESVSRAAPLRLVVRLRRITVGGGNDDSAPDWFALLPDGQLAPGSRGYDPVGAAKRRRQSLAESGGAIATRPPKKGPARGMAAAFEPGSPQHTFWTGVELTWNMMGLAAAGERVKRQKAAARIIL
jgi:hypothetical protein